MNKSVTVGRPPKSTQPLSKQLILQTALPIIQTHGADALSFRLLAERLKVTPMAVAYHSGNKRQLLADLVDFAFRNTLREVDEESPSAKVRSILSAYCKRALENANLLRAVLEDVSIIGKALIEVTNELRVCTQQCDNGDADDILLHLLVDYTHGFVLSASSVENNPLTIDDFLRRIDWIVARTAGGIDMQSK